MRRVIRFETHLFVLMVVFFLVVTALVLDSAVVRSLWKLPSSPTRPSPASFAAPNRTYTATAGAHESDMKQAIDQDKGCGLIQDATSSARWIPYDEEDLDYYSVIEPCMNRLDLKPYMASHPSTLKKLQCGRRQLSSSPRELVRSTLGKYDRVSLLGDSILRQQFFALVCSIDPTITKEQVEVPNIQRSRSHYEYTFTHGKNNNQTTQIIMRYTGFQSDPKHKAFRETIYPRAIRTSTDRDAIVLNAGTHYIAPRANYMEQVMGILANKSSKSRTASLFYMEPHSEEWPTRNGMFTEPCMWQCECEPVDEARLEGRGALSGHVDYTTELPRLPNRQVFERLYRESNYTATYHDNQHAASCIPDCSPARWRVDLVRYVLDNTPNHRLQVVPVYWQLVALGMQVGQATARRTGDCTHKNIQSLIFMNSQLIRMMDRTLVSSLEN